ncbi:DUF222 domain-containing protein [Arthrobacter sp. ATA002]|uniref:HNH endonuclease signature motif containing protein n=1 Tax=Arthrobacter sp. ATA002 TaxID=2991715 RepID=UPI0022A6B9A5|nr:HNH endonuclease signature motif containing protein [Arthrobacter sp. ATA002]WAP52172.1 DUF222 domain-containing protein [Arthrobacter sp. ATA002]
MDQHRSFPDTGTGGSHSAGASAAGFGGSPAAGHSAGHAAGPRAGAAAVPRAGAAAVPSRAVYAPSLAASSAGTATGSRGRLAGVLTLESVETLNQDEAGIVLAKLDHLVRWAQAQQAKVLDRMERIFREEFLEVSAQGNPGLAFSLAAEEAAAILSLPAGTAKMLMSRAGDLCNTHAATLQALESGTIGYGHVQAVLDQSQNIPAAEVARFEGELLTVAGEQTQAQLRVKARRLREKRYPETVVVRHKSAFESRRVCLQPDEDGMSWLSAFLPAPKAQAIFTQLSTAARGEQQAGDPRLVDQLRADILTDLLGGPDPDGEGVWVQGTEARADTGTGVNRVGGNEDGRHSTGSGGDIDGAGSSGDLSSAGSDRFSGPIKKDVKARKARTEILVLISAETLCGADEQPAELHGYGPISPETARKLARQAARWTPVERDPDTEEILRVGRRRKVPEGLQRWLRFRDATCRFPGCRTNALMSEIDHTTPWARGGATDHDNLEHLCRRHHMFKTKGFWKARQTRAGIIEWTSPGGRTYRTEPQLSLVSGGAGSGSVRSASTGTGPGAEPEPDPVLRPEGDPVH